MAADLDDLVTRDESIVAQMDLISREVAHSTPLVSESEPLGNLKNEYLQDNRFLAKIDHLLKKYSQMRRIRGDGNCFYRAFTYMLFDTCQKQQDLRESIFKKLDTTLPWLIKLGMPSFTTEDFHETFVDSLKSHCESGTYETMMETFNNDGMSNYLVVYIRLLATGQLHEKSEEYMPFVDGLYRNMKEFCDKEVLPVDREADHIQILALTQCLDFPLKLVYVDRSEGEANEVSIPHGCDSTVTLLYRPGHYDILYN